jgi:PhnB protein
MHLHLPDTDVVCERALKAGATSLFEPEDQPYRERSGGVMDEWGNYW